MSSSSRIQTRSWNGAATGAGNASRVTEYNLFP